MQNYTLEDMNLTLEALKANGAKVFSIGKSVLDRDIPCVFKGNISGPQILIHGCIHAREYITTPLVLEMFTSYFDEIGVWCVPCVNPDGLMLAQFGLDAIDDEKRKEFLFTANRDSDDFSQWKANANAVDLNVNFNADWGTGTLNVTDPSPANYIGEYPMSEPEVQSLAMLTLKLQPQITLSYHTKGEVIFWGYEGIYPYPEFTEEIAAATGYQLLTSTGSAGGYKDWFVLTSKKLGLTVEAGNEQWPTPISLDHLPEIYEQNKTVLQTAADVARKMWQE